MTVVLVPVLVTVDVRLVPLPVATAPLIIPLVARRLIVRLVVRVRLRLWLPYRRVVLLRPRFRVRLRLRPSVPFWIGLGWVRP